ncbi:MAG: hypothetical protein M1608_01415 [Candidatus Omnitrophica bacterium]|nr:hypothetical protein [Candidatus Omnitrophota bacterium]
MKAKTDFINSQSLAKRLHLPIPYGLPRNLADWLERHVLAGIALEVGAELLPANRSALAWTGTDGELSGQRMVSLLCFSYATGTYSSEVICQRIAIDEVFDYLANHCRPNWPELQRFRRLQRPIVREGLIRLFMAVWQLKACQMDSRRAPFVDRPSPFWCPQLREELRNEFAGEAENRLRRAVQWDSASMDD